MGCSPTKQYWRSLADLDRPAHDPYARPSEPDFSRFTRRAFLETSGFAAFVAALAGCSRAPTELALSPLEASAECVPGKASYFASVCSACPSACGMLVKSRDGRPIKLDGNPDHPLSRGGVCAVGQASLLELYDSRRLRQPLKDGKEIGWDRLDAEIGAKFKEIRRQAGAVRFLTDTVTSPTRRAMIARFLAGFPDARHVVYDPCRTPRSSMPTKRPMACERCPSTTWGRPR